MISKVIRIKLLSDLCPASGDGFAGVVDTDVCFEDNGLPYIPGKRLKGCLRECGLDILGADHRYESDFDKLFGLPGELIPGTMTIGNGRLENYDEVAASITPQLHRSEIIDYYTATRTRTRIEHGKAVPGSLRTVRVINRGNFFEFPVSLPEDGLPFLEMCVKSLRAMGLNRSRGLGEITCTLAERKDGKDSGRNKDCVSFTMEDRGPTKALSYVLTLAEPVISAERSGKPYACEDYIFGSAVLGALAAQYIRKQGLNPSDAYTDGNFRRIFLDGAVTFTAAMPYENGKVHTPAPLSLKTDKSRQNLSDTSGGIFKEKDTFCRKLGGFIAVGPKGSVERTEPSKIVFLHHARPQDKAMGHANADDGELYSYEALSAGQTFAGQIIGQEKDLRTLAALLADHRTLRIGRSRTAQYGRAELLPCANPPALNRIKLNCGDVFRLVAVTPLILQDKNGINTTDLTLLAKFFGPDFQIVRYLAAETTVAGYYGKWLLPKTQSRAVAEGSVVVFRYNGGGMEISDGFIGLRSGLRKNEGFGQFRVEAVPGEDAFHLVSPAAAQPEISTDNTSKPRAEILKRRAEKKAVTLGTLYGEGRKEKPLNTGLHRIISAVRKSEDFNALAQKLCDIKQPSQQRAAIAFASGKEERHFQTDAARLNPEHAARLFTERAETLLPKERGEELFPEAEDRYKIFQQYLIAAAVRIMQIRRKNQPKGGESDE